VKGIETKPKKRVGYQKKKRGGFIKFKPGNYQKREKKGKIINIRTKKGGECPNSNR